MGGLVGIGAAAAGLAGCSASAPTGSPSAPVPSTAPSVTAAGGGATGNAAPGAGGSAAPSVQPRTMPAILTQPGPDISSGPRTGSGVALTFHGAGEIALTVAVLDLARRAGARLTIFAVGQWLAANASVGRDIVADGHDLGNHTWSHQQMPSLSAARARQEITDGAAAVARAVGSAGLLFRPSGTRTSTPTIRAAAAAAGYQRCISYDVDPRDYQDPGRDAVASRTIAAMTTGSIVSLHLGHQGTVDALPAIFTALGSRGLRAVRVTDLLSAA